MPLSTTPQASAVPRLILRSPRASPFNVKVLFAASELGILDNIVMQEESHSDKKDVEPVSVHKLPTLELPSSISIHGHATIVQYLDFIAPSARLLPPATTSKRFLHLSQATLADDLLSTAYHIRQEAILRPQEHLHSQAWLEMHKVHLARCIPGLATDLELGDPENEDEVLSLPGIATAAALWYVSSKFGEVGWRDGEGGEELAIWFEKVQRRKTWQAVPKPKSM